ncbi:unnamed protein product [Symbiodinium sp. CCMP2456]|nr:unnamed protein product [Symbiodinium sp. CCMP2456]
MGGRGKGRWGGWQNGAAEGWDWQQSAASSSARGHKGSGKWDPPTGRRTWNAPAEGHNQFPGFEEMKPKPRQEQARRTADIMEVDAGAPMVGDYMKSVQRSLNNFRKAEGRARKIEEMKTETDAKWDEFKKSLQESFLKERQKYQDKATKFAADMEEMQALRNEAIQELRDSISNPGRLRKTKLLTGPPTDRSDGLTNLLAEALSNDMGGNAGRARLLEVLDEHRRRGAPATPPRRRRTYTDTTPPGDKSADKSKKEEQREGEDMITDATGESGLPKDPYMNSPSTASALPTTARSASRSRNRCGHAPIKKLEEKRLEATKETEEVDDSDEESRIANLRPPNGVMADAEIADGDAACDLYGILLVTLDGPHSNFATVPQAHTELCRGRTGDPATCGAWQDRAIQAPKRAAEAHAPLTGWHGPSGDHVRPSGVVPQRRTVFYDILDVVKEGTEALEEAFLGAEAALRLTAQGAMRTLLAIHLGTLLIMLLAAARGRNRALRGPLGKLCLAVFVAQEAAAMRTNNRRWTTTVPRPTDIELWSCGLLTTREQEAKAWDEVVWSRPLTRSIGEAPPLNLHAPLTANQAQMEDDVPIRVIDGRFDVHVTHWITTPFYQAEVIDIEMEFPLDMLSIRQALRESVSVIPAWADEIVDTKPQLGRDHSSFVAFPSWLAQVGQTAMVIDARGIDGPVFSFYHEGPINKEAVLKHIEDFDTEELEIYPFGSQLPLLPGHPVPAVPGGVLKALPRGQVCEWHDELADRLGNDERWDPECVPPEPIEGDFTVYQSTEDQLVHEDDPEQTATPTDVAAELFPGMRYVKFPVEEIFKLAHAGRHIDHTVAVVDKDWPDDAPFAFLDLRGLGCFSQWVRVPGDYFDPVAYYEDLQLPEVAGWTLEIRGGEPVAENLLHIRDGELIEFHMAPSSSTSEDEATDRDGDTSDCTGQSDSDMQSSSSTDRRPGTASPRRGPPRPTPVNRSRSPRRPEGREAADKPTIELFDKIPPATFDLTASTLQFPHDWNRMREFFRPWSPTWMQPNLTNLELPDNLKAAVEATSHWSELMPLLGNEDNPWDLQEAQGTHALRAEQIALAAALLWLLQFRSVHPMMDCTFRFDCLAAGYGMSGQWAPPDPYGERVHELAMLACEASGAHTVMEHVKAHCGNTWNEVADAIARTASTGTHAFDGPPLPAIQCFQQENLAWVTTALLARRTGTLPIHNGALQWSESHPKDYNLTQQELIPTVKVGPAAHGSQEAPAQFALCAATVNIQGLSGHHHYVEEQCDQLGLNVVFMQETKAAGGTCATLISTGELPSGCTEADVAVRHQEPRLLVITVATGSGKIAMVAGHCPHTSLPRERAHFLKTLSEQLCAVKNAALVVMGIDLNGRIPANYAGVTGSVECGEPDDAGWTLVDSLANIGAWIPSSFDRVHDGDSETYHHPSGTCHRIDYIVLGGRAVPGHTSSWINHQFDNGSPNVDHYMLQVQCQGTFEDTREGQRLWRPRYDREKMATPEGRCALHAALSEYYVHPTWEMSVDQHCQRLQNFLAETLANTFPASSVERRASYIPDEVWHLRLTKNKFKARVRHRRQLWNDAVCRAFRQWQRDEDYDVAIAYLVEREGFLYHLASAAINVATHRVKKILNVAKNDAMRKIATEGHQGVIQILRRVKKAGFGGRRTQPTRRPLPALMNPTTDQPAVSRQERDDIWLRYFGDQEMGERMKVDKFITELVGCQKDDEYTWQCSDLPSLSLIEEVLRRTPRGKACGLDGIPSDLLSIAPTILATMLQPLYLKSMLTGAQPLQWRGGMLCEAFKNNGTHTIVENYRSLFISSFLGKSYHKTLRTLIGPEVEQLLHPLHCSTRQAAPVAFPGIFVIAALRKLARVGRSCATLFVDTKAAYYKVVRDLATGCIDSDAQVIALFRAFGLDEEDLHDMMTTISRGGMLAEAGVNSQLRHAIKDLNLRTWFVTSYHGGGDLCWSKAGSRPGESFADVIYAFIYSRVLYRVHEHLVAEELNFAVEWEEDTGVFPTGQGGSLEQAWDATWADDSAYVVEDRCPERLVRKARRVGALVLGILTSHGMQPNVKPGKTSYMIQLRGPGSTTARKRHFPKGKAALAIPDLALEIPTVSQYRHLGGIIDLKLSFRPEARHRLAIASQAYDTAKKLLLNNRDLELPTRVALFEIAVTTTYFNLALWRPHGPTWENLCSGHASLARRLLTRNIAHDLLFKIPLAMVLWVTKCLPLDLIARRQRLSLLVSLVKAAPGLLWGVLQEEQEWMATIREDLAWVVRRREEQWPPLRPQAWPEWWRILRSSPQRLKRAVRRRLSEEQEERILPAAIDLCLWAMAKALRADTRNGERVVTWRCRKCQLGFAAKSGLSVHHFKTHGRVATYRIYAQGTRCGACGTECWSEGRLAAHLRAAPLCVGALQAIGSRARNIAPGFGSRARRKADVDQYTPAVPERDGAREHPGADPTWHPTVVEAYQDLCGAIQDEAAEPYEETTACVINKILAKYPLYQQEEDEILVRIEEDIDDLHKDQADALWAPEHARAVLDGIHRSRDDIWRPAEKQGSTRVATLQEFKTDLEATDWGSLLGDRLRHGTRSVVHVKVPVSWEAEWLTALKDKDLSAVASDALSLLPVYLATAWRATFEGHRLCLEAPQSFIASKMALPFAQALASNAL